MTDLDAVLEAGVQVRSFGPVLATVFAELPGATRLNTVRGGAESGAVEEQHLPRAIEWMAEWPGRLRGAGGERAAGQRAGRALPAGARLRAERGDPQVRAGGDAPRAAPHPRPRSPRPGAPRGRGDRDPGRRRPEAARAGRHPLHGPADPAALALLPGAAGGRGGGDRLDDDRRGDRHTRPRRHLRRLPRPRLQPPCWPAACATPPPSAATPSPPRSAPTPPAPPPPAARNLRRFGFVETYRTLGWQLPVQPPSEEDDEGEGGEPGFGLWMDLPWGRAVTRSPRRSRTDRRRRPAPPPPAPERSGSPSP